MGNRTWQCANRKIRNFRYNQSNDLAAGSSTSIAARFLVIAAAVLLVSASAGFATLFAWRVGSGHDVALGVLSVVMALGLKLSEPFALASAFSAFRQFRIVTGAVLLATGLLAVAFSLQAELTFMASTRGDMISERASEAGAAARAEQRYQAAAAALASLQPTGTTKSATNAYLARREALAAELRSAEQDRRSAPVAVVADPGAVALATYADALGWKWDADQLGRWMPLVGVLALELGAAFSVVLVRSVAPPRVAQVAQPQNTGDTAAQQTTVRAKVRKQPSRRDDDDDSAGPPKRGLPALLDDHVRANGGVVDMGQRKLARQLGASRTSLQRALNELAASGAVVLSSSAAGTRIALA